MTKKIFGGIFLGVGIILFIFFSVIFGLLGMIVGSFLFTMGVIDCKVDEINEYRYLNGPGVLSPDEEKYVMSNGGWKCPDCGRINRVYETTCKCGKTKM
ncbi:MAG: hypothetical protein ACI4EU_06250 [Butyrivibrio sp.]